MRQHGRPLPGMIGFFAPRTGIEEIALVTMVAGAAVSAVGAISQGQAAAAAASQNANAARAQAQIEQQQGDLAYQQQLRQSQIARGKSLAVLSDSGVDPSQGSPLDLLSQQARTGEFNAEETRFQYQENAWKMMVGAQGDDLAGAAALSKGTSTAVGGLLGGIGKGLGGIDFGTDPVPTNPAIGAASP